MASDQAVLQNGLRRYLSEADLLKLAAVRVGIAGAGGLGSNCAMLLVRSGIRKFLLVDHDLVDASNLNRQFYFPEDVGHPKVEALSRNLKRLDPALDIRFCRQRLQADNALELFSDCDLVVEALDQAEDKAMLCGLLVRAGIFVVAASGIAGKSGPPMQKRFFGKKFVCVGDFISEVDADHPPLAPRVMQAASLQAEVALHVILSGKIDAAGCDGTD